MTTDLENRVKQLEGTMETVQATLQQIAQVQLDNAKTVERLSQRVDSFVFESQRLFARLGESSARSEAAIETLAALATRSDRDIAEQRDRFEASQQRQDSMIDRLDRLVNYLMGQK
jgi:hypothetical protein